MEIKECKTENFIIRETEKILLDIINEIKSYHNPNILELNSVYCDTIKKISFLKEGKTTLLGIINHKYNYYEDLVIVSFEKRELKVEIKNSSEFLNFMLREKFTEFALKNENSIKSLYFISGF